MKLHKKKLTIMRYIIFNKEISTLEILTVDDILCQDGVDVFLKEHGFDKNYVVILAIPDDPYATVVFHDYSFDEYTRYEHHKKYDFELDDLIMAMKY